MPERSSNCSCSGNITALNFLPVWKSPIQPLPNSQSVWWSFYASPLYPIPVELTCTAGKNSCRRRKNQRLETADNAIMRPQETLRWPKNGTLRPGFKSRDLWKREMLCFFPLPGSRWRRGAQRPQSELSNAALSAGCWQLGRADIFSWVWTSSLFLQNFLPGRLVDFR